jgi:hypothetical protein
MRTDNKILSLAVIGLAMAILNFGCTALMPFPTAARPGETVALAVGSADNLTRDNINSVTFESTNPCCTAPLDITSNVDAVFKLYADKTSEVYEAPGPGTNQIIRSSLHEPWVSIIAINLPEEYSPGVPLPTGPATITINTTNDVTYPTIGYHINERVGNLAIGVEIFPEADPNDVQASTFEYEFGRYGATQLGDLSLLESRPHALIRSEYTEDPFTLSNYAAIQMKVDFTGVTATPITDDNIRVVVDDMDTYSVSNRHIITRVKDETLTVIMTSLSENLKPYEMRFSVVLEGDNSFTATPTIASTEYYDINGVSASDATLFTAEVR